MAICVRHDRLAQALRSMPRRGRGARARWRVAMDSAHSPGDKLSRAQSAIARRQCPDATQDPARFSRRDRPPSARSRAGRADSPPDRLSQAQSAVVLAPCPTSLREPCAHASLWGSGGGDRCRARGQRPSEGDRDVGGGDLESPRGIDEVTWRESFCAP